nr:hypothetical protein [Tanacetum cinerariifolium]
MFGPDAISRPSGAPRKSKAQFSSGSSSATSSSSKGRVTELMQEQILLDHKAKKESMDRELAARLAVCEIQKINEDLKILTFDTTGMNPEDATKIEALKEKTRTTNMPYSNRFCPKINDEFKGLPQCQKEMDFYKDAVTVSAA